MAKKLGGGNTFEIQEDGGYGEKETTMRDILISHIKKISEICSQEFTAGYWQSKPINMQGGVFMSKTYHEDSFEAYSNAVDFLVDLLYPKGDTDFQKIIDTHEALDFDKMDKKQKMKKKRIIFKEINKMFERINFFSSGEFLEE
jgi:hypothetical protein